MVVQKVDRFHISALVVVVQDCVKEDLLVDYRRMVAELLYF